MTRLFSQEAYKLKNKWSIQYISNPDNLDTASQMIVDGNILPALQIAKSALSNLSGSIVFIDGVQMKSALVDFYNILIESMPQSIGNALPDDSFYYVA